MEVNLECNALHFEALFFRKMKGRCFNCLARGHKVASCRDLARCWRCREFGHISYECPSHCSDLNRRRLEGSCPRGTLAHDNRDSNVVDDCLLLERDSSSVAYQRSFDPMVLEASIVVSSSSEEGMKQNQLSETPLQIRSTADQQIGHELIKALSIFKHNMSLQQSHSTPSNISPKKEASVVSQKSNEGCGQKSVTKTKRHKPSVKVTRDMLTKKWVFIKLDKQMGSWPLSRFLDIYKKLSRASSIEATRLAMIMQEVRKLAYALEKRKKEKKSITSKHDPAKLSK